jgi:hypothetical protein
VHQNLQHDWWKEGPKNEQLAVAQEAQPEEEEDDEDDYERVVQNSNSFLLFVVFHGELQNKTLGAIFFGYYFVAKMGAMMMIHRKILAKNWATS